LYSWFNCSIDLLKLRVASCELREGLAARGSRLEAFCLRKGRVGRRISFQLLKVWDKVQQNSIFVGKYPF